VFRAGELARFQRGTDPEHERRGVCRTLVHRTALMALDGGARALVMCADAEHHAARVYESLGFVPSEKLTGVLRP
jgi:predicted GNAT family acetyltransferase